MYAVIKTGGKQYRVSPGDVLVVEKLAGDPGAVVAFDEVLMVGDGPTVTIGAPTVAGASVSATLIETRKGKKIKIFKKIRRQGYRRTRGHRQTETVLRVTALTADGASEAWDGVVDLTPLAELNARARNLARGMEAAAAKAATKVEQLAARGARKAEVKSAHKTKRTVTPAKAVNPEAAHEAPAKAAPAKKPVAAKTTEVAKAKAAPKAAKPKTAAKTGKE